jgi:uncharacterized protein (DUF1800 family)
MNSMLSGRPACDDPRPTLSRRRWLAASGALAAAPLLGGLAGCAAPTGGGRSPGALLDPEDLAVLNRLTWGMSAGSAAGFARLGRRDWLQAQLHPDPRAALPDAVQARIDALSISGTPFEALVAQLDERRRGSIVAVRDAETPADKLAANRDYQQALTRVAREAASRQLLRALYAPNQLQEQLTWFWFNHFNVHQFKANLRVMVGDYEDRALRPRALGRFRDLLVASATHPAMLRYLDNERNAAGRINENFARELMELHTLGIDGGYTQKDVQELARVLTGLGVNPTGRTPNLRAGQRALYVRQGLTEFNPARHDMGEKLLLGRPVAGRGWDEILDELGRLAAHPSTARFVSRKLAVQFAADAPPPALVDRMAQAFTRSDGDIAVVMEALCTAPEFAPTLGRKFKDPLHYVVSAVRLLHDERPVADAAPLLGWLARLGQSPYNRQTPDGYPADEPAWTGPGQMATRFEIARAIAATTAAAGGTALFGSDSGAAGEPPGSALRASRFFQQQIARTLGAPTRAALDAARSPQEWTSFLLSSPEFMLR